MIEDLVDIHVYNEAPFQWSLYASGQVQSRHQALIQDLKPTLSKLLTGLIVVLSEHESLAMRSLLDCHTEETLAMCLEIDITLVSDAEIQALNHEHRSKAEATDVLSFPLFEDPVKELPALTSLPFLTLGSVVISLDWAVAHWQAEPDCPTISAYLQERIIHGCLHVLGIHHATMPDFERVKTLQSNILTYV